MYPVSNSEILMYSTVRLTASDGSTGTGFFFQFEVEDKLIPVIITNKHVVNYNPYETVTFKLHTGDYERKIIDETSVDVTLNEVWRFHPTHDLCFCYINPILEKVRQELDKRVFFTYITQKELISNSQLEELNAMESVKMIGYPNGVWNEKHNLPRFRSGITASHPAVDFNEPGVGVVDMACFPGSSGSPIFILDENGYSDKNGNTYFGKSRIILLGVLFAGPIMTIDGKIVVEKQNNIISKSSVMINLGYYAKSYELLSFIDIIKRDLGI